MGLCDAKLLPFLQLHYRGINGPNPAYMWSLNGWQQPTVTDLWPNWWTAYGRKVDGKRSVSTRYTIRSPSSLVSQWLPSSTVTGVILAHCTTSWHALKETYYASFFFFFSLPSVLGHVKGFESWKAPSLPRRELISPTKNVRGLNCLVSSPAFNYLTSRHHTTSPCNTRP